MDIIIGISQVIVPECHVFFVVPFKQDKSPVGVRQLLKHGFRISFVLVRKTHPKTSGRKPDAAPACVSYMKCDRAGFFLNRFQADLDTTAIVLRRG
jgi:hypothetical protein